MTTFKTIIITSIFCLSGLFSLSQTTNAIDSLENKCQECLDRGVFMLGCSETFYYQMDSILNTRYKVLRSKCSTEQKNKLKTEQLKWLSERNKQFKINEKNVHKQAVRDGLAGGQDEEMILTHKNAMFVKKRVLELINKNPNDYN